ncbi:MAG TPA: hypothetical protein PLX71_03220 [Phycicoccus sp.]|nr:hypothetical protein [Phycicoccus sp.]
MIRHQAPTAPGALGERLDPGAVQVYLADLAAWSTARRAELDEFDAEALAANRAHDLTADLTLSMALWKSVADRLALLQATWDGGRVGPRERERLSVLIWGRLDTTTAGPATNGSGSVAVSLPEACRLSDALASQLRVRLALDPAADEFARRLKDLRAQVERLRDQVALEPEAARPPLLAHVDDIASRTSTLTDKASRGADIGGLIGPLENDAARLEHDLIVGAARRRDAADLARAVAAQRDTLLARGAALQALATQTVAEVDPAPNYAVPDVAALGPVPGDPGALAAYRQRLGRVGQALEVAQEAYAAALRSRSDLTARLDASDIRAGAIGVADLPDVRVASQTARALLARRPAPLPVAGAAVALCEAWVAWWGSERGVQLADRPRVSVAKESGS